MKLAGRIEIAAPGPQVWELVLDPLTLAACVPGVKQVRKIDDKTFEGSITASVGPMDGDFTFTAVITEAVYPDTLVVEMSGIDSVTKSRLEVLVTGALVVASETQTALTYRADVKVKGRLAILGEMILRATASMMINQVTACLKSKLEAPAA
jgi:carbon monoxide dehydrogenase subunit G